jgi:hypothetical protein
VAAAALPLRQWRLQQWQQWQQWRLQVLAAVSKSVLLIAPMSLQQQHQQHRQVLAGVICNLLLLFDKPQTTPRPEILLGQKHLSNSC